MSLAQPDFPEQPHRVYGEITDSDTGDPVEGLNVSFVGEEKLAETSTDEDGIYDARLEDGEEGEEAYLFIQDVNRSEYVTFESGSSERIDYQGDFDTDQDDGDDNGDDENGDDSDDENGDDENGDDNGDDSDDENGDDENGSDDDDSDDSSDDDSDDSSEDESDTNGGGGGGLPGDDGDDENGSDDENGEDGNGEEGSLAPPESEDFEVELDGFTDLEIEEILPNQQVNIDIIEDSGVALKGLSFTPSEAIEEGRLTLADSESTLSGVSIGIAEEVYAYIDIDTEGISSPDTSEMAISVDSAWLEERDRDPEDMEFARYNSQTDQWEAFDLDYITPELGGYRYSTDFLPGAFAVYLPEEPEEEPDIQLDNLDYNRIENSSSIVIEASVSNSGNAFGEEQFTLTADGDQVETFTASLDAGESTTLSYETEISEDTVFSMSGQQVTVEHQGISVVYYVLLALGVLFILALIIIIKYLSEQRKAREMERQLQGIRNREENVEQRMRSLRQNVDNLRRKLHHED